MYTMKCYSAVQNEVYSVICNNVVNMEHIKLNEIGQAEKDKYFMIALKCGT